MNEHRSKMERDGRDSWRTARLLRFHHRNAQAKTLQAYPIASDPCWSPRSWWTTANRQALDSREQPLAQTLGVRMSSRLTNQSEAPVNSVFGVLKQRSEHLDFGAKLYQLLNRPPKMWPSSTWESSASLLLFESGDLSRMATQWRRQVRSERAFGCGSSPRGTAATSRAYASGCSTLESAGRPPVQQVDYLFIKRVQFSLL